MKKLFLISTLFFISLTTVLAQQKEEITLEDIWRDSKFNASSVGGLRSMNDGVHYTTLVREEEGVNIVKYAYADKKYQEILVSASDLKFEDKIIRIN